MKKSLFAVAAVTAFAGAAQAQSSVTVYGLLDVGYMGTNTRGTTGAGNVNTGSAGTVQAQQQTSQFAASSEQTSRLGFKGNEDMGGGLSAFFTIETGLTPTSGTVSTWNDRQSFVGLKKNGIGQFAIGTQYTPVFNEVVATDPGQLNNMVGNVIYATNNFGNNANGQGNVNQMGFGGTAAGTTVGAGSGNDGFTSRASNTLSVQSERVAGFQASAVYVLNNVNQTQAGVGSSGTLGGNSNWNGWGLSADYTWNKLYVTGAYQAFKSINSAANSVSAPQPQIASAALGGTNTQDNQGYVAATYDFGILKGYANWITRKATDTVNSNYYAKRQAQQLGVRSYITPVIEAWASVGNGRYTAFGQANPTANFTAYQVGSNYYLSKRTNLYAIFGSTETSSTSSTPGVSGNGYALGVRHTF